MLVLYALLAALTQSASPSPSRCVIEGSKVTLQEVTVRPAGAAPFTVDLAGATLRAELPAKSGAAITLFVAAPLRFVAERQQVRFLARRDATTPDALVTLKAGATLYDAHQAAGAVVAKAVLSTDDVLDGEAKAPDEFLSGVEVPCAALTLEPTSFDGPTASAEAVRGDAGAHQGRWWSPLARGSRLQLWPGPRAAGAVRTLEAPQCEGCLAVHELKASGEWLLVETRDDQGLVTVQGWAPRSSLTTVDAPGTGRGVGCSGAHDHQERGESRVGPPPDGFYEGEARVKAGAAVFSQPPGGRWATFEQETTVQVRLVRGQPWAQVREVAGLGPLGASAAVRAEDVLLPQAPKGVASPDGGAR